MYLKRLETEKEDTNDPMATILNPKRLTSKFETFKYLAITAPRGIDIPQLIALTLRLFANRV